MTQKKIYSVVTWVAGALMLSVLIYDVLVFTEKTPIIYTNVPFPVSEDRTYKPGEELRLVVSRCVSRPLSYALTQTIVADDFNAPIREYYLESQKIIVDAASCSTVLGIPKIIPSYLPSGNYHISHGISTEGRYRNFIFTVDSQSFEIQNDEPVDFIPPVIMLYDPKIIPIFTPVSPQVIYIQTSTPPQSEKNNQKKEEKSTEMTKPQPAIQPEKKETPLLPSIINKII